ncbi:adenine phosphoribosyltransferase [Mycoplasmatota bacterium zrk1]
MDLKDYISNVPDFPKKGIQFKDITPLMQDGKAFHEAVSRFVEYAKKVGADIIVGPEARGFIFGCPTATELSIGFIPVRKPGKLPRETIDLEYDLEYGSNKLSMHSDSIKPNQKVLIVDDLLATGGTVKATVDIIERMKGKVVGIAFLIELDFLKGRDILSGYDIMSILHY